MTSFRGTSHGASRSFFASRKQDIQNGVSSVPEDAWRHFAKHATQMIAKDGNTEHERMRREEVIDFCFDFFSNISEIENMLLTMKREDWTTALMNLCVLTAEELVSCDSPDDLVPVYYMDKEYFIKHFLAWTSFSRRKRDAVTEQKNVLMMKRVRQHTGTGAGGQLHYTTGGPTDIHSQLTPFMNARLLMSLYVKERGICNHVIAAEQTYQRQFRLALLTHSRVRTPAQLELLWSFVAHVPLFRKFNLTKKDQINVCKALFLLEVKQKTVLFDVGDMENSFYIIFDGLVDISINETPPWVQAQIEKNPENKEELTKQYRRSVNQLSDGQSFGDFAMISGNPRTFRVEALATTMFLVLDRRSFEVTLKVFEDRIYAEKVLLS